MTGWSSQAVVTSLKGQPPCINVSPPCEEIRFCRQFVVQYSPNDCVMPAASVVFYFLPVTSPPLPSPSLPASSNFSLPPGQRCISEDLSQTCHSPPVHQMPSDFPINPGHSTTAPTCSHSQIVPTCPPTWLSLSHQSFSVQYGSSSPALSLHLFVTLCTCFPAICTCSPVLDSSAWYLLSAFWPTCLTRLNLYTCRAAFSYPTIRMLIKTMF